ncbi:MAG TPA: trypsin-like peptidase domain-containing protein [Kofleriaceae bacterium]|nr:trypsin-like peptidase domain-containing protein [Kofleriaceae bacterium]
MGPVTRLACVFVLACVATAHAQPTPQQKVAMTSKPSVVRVWGAYIATYELGGEKVQEAIGGTGTGWFMTPDGYIATNAHVVEDIHNGDDAAKETLYNMLLKELDKAYAKEIAQMSDDQIHALLKAIKLVDFDKRAYVVLPNGDKLPYEIKSYGKPGSGRDAAIIKVKAENAPTLPIADSAKTQVADPIVVIGYPGVADMKVLLDEKSQLQASVTDGAISSLKRASSGEQILQISAPITHGNSGGPALDMKGNVVGLATFGNESEVQGFNFLVASSTLMEMVKDAKVEPKESETSKAWKTGLEHYWADEYTAAIKQFEEVETLFPQHDEAQDLIRQSNLAKKEGKEKKPASNNGLVIGLVVGGVVLVGVLGLVLARRGKKGPAQPRPMQPMQPGGAPNPYGPHAGMPPQMGQQPGMPPQMPPPMGQQPYGMPPQQPMMYGRVQPGQMASGVPQPGMQQPGMQQPGMQQPIAKTVAIQAAPNQSGPVAQTAFGSLSIGSLTCTRGQLMGQRFALTATGIIIGRQPGVAHVLVNDHRASGKHVWIGIDQGRLVAIDQGTTNGTFVNDVNRGRITRQELRDGDVVIVGEPDCLSLQIRLGG